MDILNQFGINPLLLAAQIVNFLILLFLLKKFLYGPILKVLETRKQKIEQSLKNAEEIERKLAETNEQIDKMMIKASDEVQKMMDQAKKEIALMKEEGKQEAEQQVALMFQRGEESLRMEKEKMLAQAKDHVGDLAIAIFYKLTGKSLSKEEQRKLAEKEIKNLS